MSEATCSDIPPALYEELVRLRPVLERLDCCVRQRPDRDTYFLRFRVYDDEGGRVQRRITIPDDATAYAVQQMLDAWRREYGAQKAEVEALDESRRVYEQKVSELRRVVIESAGGSNRRRRAAKEFDRAAEDPVSLYYYILGGAPNLPDLRPGPKPSAGLY